MGGRRRGHSLQPAMGGQTGIDSPFRNSGHLQWQFSKQSVRRTIGLGVTRLCYRGYRQLVLRREAVQAGSH